MNRKERRKAGIKDKVPTYNLNEDQIRAAVRKGMEEEVRAEIQALKEDMVNTALTLLLTIPLEVLMNHYWQKSYRERLPKFTELVLQYYELWISGELDLEELQKDLWEYGGIRLEEKEG